MCLILFTCVSILFGCNNSANNSVVATDSTTADNMTHDQSATSIPETVGADTIMPDSTRRTQPVSYKKIIHTNSGSVPELRNDNPGYDSV